MNEQEKLEQEIKEAKYKLELLKKQDKDGKRNQVIKRLDEYTVEEKIEWFDQKYKSSLRQLEEKEDSEDYWGDNDNEHYAWEDDMEILARDNGLFWNYWNSMQKWQKKKLKS